MSALLPDALLRSQSDERLAHLAGRGHDRAFDALVRRYQQPLLGFVRATTGADHAEDVVQQAFTQAWAALQDGTDVRHVRGWLYQIVRHASWKAAAQVKATRELESAVVGTDSLHSTVESRMELRELVDNVVELPDHQRIALVQTAFEGRSRSEIAAGLGVTEGAVRQLVHRGRERLRKAAAGLIPLPVLDWLAGMERRGSSPYRGSGAARAAVESPGFFEGATKAVMGVVACGVVAAGAPIVHHQLKAERPASERGTAAARVASGAAMAAHDRPGAALTAATRGAGPGGLAALLATGARGDGVGARGGDAAAATALTGTPDPRGANGQSPSAGSSPHQSDSGATPGSGADAHTPGDGLGSSPDGHDPATDGADPTGHAAPDSSDPSAPDGSPDTAAPDSSPDAAPANTSSPDPSVEGAPADVPADEQ
jgi:RNA polymerase sigma factor (sigma-70 family)